MTILKSPFYASCLALLVAAMLPLAIGSYALTLGTDIAVFSLYVMSINLLLGWTGLTSLGHAIFLGCGGYGLAVFGVLMGLDPFSTMVLTLIAGTVLALGVSLICTRTRGVGFLLITLAFTQLMYGIAVKVPQTGGDDGMAGLPRPDLSAVGIDIHTKEGFYIYCVAVALIGIAILYRVSYSSFGYVLRGIRDDERRMKALGYRTSLFKNIAFTISGFTATLAGVLQAQHAYFINPDIMTWQIAGEGVLMAIMGGTSVVLGPVVGASVFIIVKDALSGLTGDYIFFFGLFFMATVALFRNGIAGLFIDLVAKVRQQENLLPARKLDDREVQP